MKKLINPEEYKFIIKVMPHKEAMGVFIDHEKYPKDHVLVQYWSPQDCKNWIYSHFAIPKGEHFNIEVEKSIVVEDEQGLLYLKSGDE